MKTPSEWLELLHRCQDGYATCMFVYNEIENEKREEAKRLEKIALELCWEIEKFPASEHQTATSIKASNLRTTIMGNLDWFYRQHNQ
jgi:hypothetical protein